MTIEHCNTCSAMTFDGMSLFGGRHVCPPTWRVWSPEYEGITVDDAHTFWGNDAQEAAEQWAEQWDQDDYTIIGGDTPLVFVQGEDGKVLRFQVSGETSAVYHATEKPL